MTGVETKLSENEEALIKWVKEMFAKHVKVQAEDLEKFSRSTWILIIKSFKDTIESLDELSAWSFLFKEPDFHTPKAQKSIKRVFASMEKSVQILETIKKLFETKLEEKNFKAAKIVEVLGTYLYENRKTLKHEDVYDLLRFVLSGSHQGIPASEMCEILGKSATLERINKWI